MAYHIHVPSLDGLMDLRVIWQVHLQIMLDASHRPPR